MRAHASILLAGLCTTLATPVQAQWAFRSGPYAYERDTVTRGPDHGYSGFVRFGARNYYCDYRRIPNRECVVLRSGKQSCGVKNWTLKQYCY